MVPPNLGVMLQDRGEAFNLAEGGLLNHAKMDKRQNTKLNLF